MGKVLSDKEYILSSEYLFSDQLHHYDTSQLKHVYQTQRQQELQKIEKQPIKKQMKPFRSPYFTKAAGT